MCVCVYVCMCLCMCACVCVCVCVYSCTHKTKYVNNHNKRVHVNTPLAGQRIQARPLPKGQQGHSPQFVNVKYVLKFKFTGGVERMLHDLEV